MTASVAELRGVTRSFGARVVLRDLDLTLGRGELVAVVGRSGSGKSTLLRVLAGLDREAQGDISTARPAALVFQDARLLPWLTVLRNVVLGLPAGADATGREILDEVGLAGRERSWPAELSGGEAQRVALARALVRDPALLLLDEPFGALDALTRLRMQALVRRLHTSHRPGTLLVTHDIDEAIALADRVLVLADGRFTHELALPPAAERTDAWRASSRRTLLAALGVAVDLDGSAAERLG